MSTPTQVKLQNTSIVFTLFPLSFSILFCLMTGTYYTSITNFMQGYIDNQINLNGEQYCDGTCSNFKSTINHQQCQNGTLCAHSNFAHTKCTGDIFDCSVIDSEGTACLVVGLE